MSDNLEDMLRRLRSLEPSNVLRIGNIAAGAIDFWSLRTTDEVIITGERRLHYLARHPEVLDDELLLLRALLNPEEIHTNAFDTQLAIIYHRVNEYYALRIPVWISNREDRQNSVLSMRRARYSEVERGRTLGRAVWRK
jgi:hypothetical protein